mgnify:CR=1 FL=1
MRRHPRVRGALCRHGGDRGALFRLPERLDDRLPAPECRAGRKGGECRPDDPRQIGHGDVLQHERPLPRSRPGAGRGDRHAAYEPCDAGGLLCRAASPEPRVPQPERAGGGARPVSGLRGVLRPPCAGNHRRHFETFLFRLPRRRGRRGLRPCRRGLRQCVGMRSARVARLCPGGVLPFGDRKVPGRRSGSFRMARARRHGRCAGGGPRLRRLGRRGRRAAAPGRRRTGDAVYPRCDQRHAGLQFAYPFVARHGDSAPDRAGVQRAQCPSARDVRRADPSGLSFRPLGNRRRAVRPAPEPAAQRRAADPARVERKTGRAGCEPARNQCRPEPAEHPHRRRQPHQGGLYRRSGS